MPLAMMRYAGLSAFLSDFSLQQNQGAALFRRSPRTLRRWAQFRRVPAHVVDLVDVVRHQRAPLSADYPRELRAATPELTSRLARPRPVGRRRRRLLRIAEAYAANGWVERVAQALREASPEASSDATWRLAVAMVDRAERRRCAAVERAGIERATRKAAYMRRHRRRVT